MKAAFKRLMFGEQRARTIGVGLLRGLKFVVDPQSKSQRLLGLDEKEIASHVRRAARRARTAIDVGAHDGWYATYFASRPNIMKVLACDRNAKVVERLIRNVDLNGFSHKVALELVSVGTAGTPGTRSLDDLLAHQTPPFAIKVDVDGGELDVLESGGVVLRDQDCFLIVETHSPALERDCARYLQSLGYGTKVIVNGWYRALVPETRTVPHNRWLVAERMPR